MKKIHRYEVNDLNALEDVLCVMAANIEDALIQAGVPDEEYTAMKCFELAVPFALEVYRTRVDKISFATGWQTTKD